MVDSYDTLDDMLHGVLRRLLDEKQSHFDHPVFELFSE